MARKQAVLSVLAAVLVVVGATDQARADLVFDYQFGSNAAGTLTTGLESSSDAGYYLITGLTLSSFTDVNHGAISPVSASATSFFKDAAYNPTTGDFINHQLYSDSLSTHHEIGFFFLSGNFDTLSGLLAVLPGSFSLSSSSLKISTDTPLGDFTANGALKIAAESVATPEPSTMISAGIGVMMMLGYAGRRRRAAA